MHINPASIQDMQESRYPDAVRRWLDDRINEGFNQEAVQALLRMSSEELLELQIDNRSLPYSIKITAQDIYNAVRRKAKGETILAPNSVAHTEADPDRNTPASPRASHSAPSLPRHLHAASPHGLGVELPP
ncbi:hypothetical protein M422DRAFT_245714 [Sphaerobolus stellatus SS14]|nr:hypothetical protein M422DRAFT_245714 [Sphaerobolus stellatus SS14]